jgi:hypothetical protein
MPRVEDSLLWLIPGLFLALFMVHAMMQFTMALVTKSQRSGQQPVGEEELPRRLLAIRPAGGAYQVRSTNSGDITIDWQLVDPSWHERYAKVKISSKYTVRFFLDERRQEVRLYEHIRTASFFVGLDDPGLRPRFTFPLSFFAGPMEAVWSGTAYGILPGFLPRIGESRDFSIDTTEAKNVVLETCRKSGWTWRQVFWLPETTQWGFTLSQALVPGPLRQWPGRRFWGVLYPLSYVLSLGYLLTVSGAWNIRIAIIVGGVSLAWWGLWAFITWALLRLGNINQHVNRPRRRERIHRS